jgi:hypothetical protein
VGFASDIANKVRGFFSKDKETAAKQLSRGVSADRFSGSASDLLNTVGVDGLSEFLRLDSDLLARYADYEDMDDYPELAAALDILADDATQPNTPINRTMWVTSKDQTVAQTLDDLYHRTLRMDEEIWEIARNLVKYGNNYEEMLITGNGVVGLNFLPSPTMRRVEADKGELLGFVQDYKGKYIWTPQEFDAALKQRGGPATTSVMTPSGVASKVTAFEGWEVAHYRLRGKYRRSLYGYSALEPARWIWKRLVLLEDAALIYRLQRAPERFAFYIDVGDLPPAEALGYVNRVRQQFKKKKWVNPSTGRVDMKFDPLSQDEDFFVPSRKGSDSARIETLGAPQWQSMEDIEYFRDKMFAAIKVPKAYLAQEAGVARAVLSSEDVRFARTVLRIQRELTNGSRKIGRVHLSALGIDPSRVEWDLNMTVPSAVFELAQMEVRNARADLANRMREFVSMHWMLSNVFALSDKEIETIFNQRAEDDARVAVSQAQAQAAQQAVMSAVPGGGEMPGAEAGMEAGAEAGAEPDAAPESVQVTARALREGKILLSPGARSTRSRPMSERELFAGDRESERRATEKLDALMKSDRRVAARVEELRGLMTDLKAAVGTRRR